MQVMQTRRFITEVTSELQAEHQYDLELDGNPQDFRPVPLNPDQVAPDTPIWRVSFDLAYNTQRHLDVEINGEFTLGRGAEQAAFISLDEFDADELGVSRMHALIRPTESQLFIVDLGSTNGTWINGRSIGVNMPCSLSNGDLLTLGKLELSVRIVERPARRLETNRLQPTDNDMLLSIAKTLTARLDIEEILERTVELTMSAIAAEEASLWLLDEHTNELVLEVARGLDEGTGEMRLSTSETLAGKVIHTGKPVRTHRKVGDDRIKVKTGYLVEAVMYVPLTVAGVPIGVLSAAHHQAGQRFSEWDQTVLGHIADFTTVAVQNARLFEATSKALEQHVRMITVLNYAITVDAKALLNSMIGYTGLLDLYTASDDDARDIVNQVVSAGEAMTALLERMVKATRLSDTNIVIHQRCDLIEAVYRAVRDRQRAAEEKQITLDLQIDGEPYLIFGDGGYLYRAVLNLVDNAVRFSGYEDQVTVLLDFTLQQITISVSDTGPGIAKEMLPHLFKGYVRGQGTINSKPGIGLGLEVVRVTVDAHRGTVTARNRGESGAEFIIALPGALRFPPDD